MPPRRTDSSRGAPLGAPLLVLNLKVYPAALGIRAERIGRALARIGGSAGVRVALAPAQTDVARLARVLPIPVLAQHVDPDEAGARTGFVVAEAVAAAGARGSLVNHSEHRMSREDVVRSVERMRGLGLVPVVCARDEVDSEDLARIRPPYLAVEPPELIGGTVSVSTARPEVIEETVRSVRAVSPRTHVLCGAGVHTSEDVRRALELGSEGILVSSAVARATDPAKAIRELVRGFRVR